MCANHACITCSTLISAVINQLLTLVSLVTKCAWVRWNSWNHFGCGINEDLIKQTGTPAPPAHTTSSSPSSTFSVFTHACLLSFFFPVNEMKNIRIFCVFSERKRRRKKIPLHV
jgi:hypothetical protein